MAPSYPSIEHILAAAHAVARSLEGSEIPYAIVGGAACLLLGSARLTSDVDFVVPMGRVRDARQLLRAYNSGDSDRQGDSKAGDRFAVQSRTNHTTYLSDPPIEIQILAPPALFREPFDETSPTVDVDGIRVLKPTLLLNAKCRSVLARAQQDKKTSDAHDIRFLLQWCAANGVSPTASEVPNATKDFVNAFVASYGGAYLWRAAGYELNSGMVSPSTPLSLF